MIIELLPYNTKLKLFYTFFILTGAIEVTIANMAKAERISTDQVYVVGFVPSYQLPKSRPSSLDPFLHPLVSDIENIFINGKKPCVSNSVIIAIIQ